MSNDANGYNGWTNRETWAVALHINNDQGWQEQVLDIVREEIALTDDPEELDAFGIADLIESNVTSLVDPLAYVEEFGDDITLKDWANGPGMAARDIGYLDRVNWTELAESFIRDARENDN